MWKIYYSDTVVEGNSRQDWEGFPDSDVQVVVEIKDPSHFSYRTYKDSDGKNIPVYGKELWDGTDEFDPFGYGVKFGRLLTDDEFFLIWNTACAD